MSVTEYINSKKDTFINDLKRLVEINSVRTPPLEGMPFGEGGAKVLAEADKILTEHGYSMKNYGNYAGEADFGKNPCLMLLAHLDTVPAGDGWTRQPYRLTLEGNKAFGRGTTDDKGAAVAMILAMDACRKIYGEPKKGVRLVLGCGEETGSEDTDMYFSKRPTLKYTLSPDADYPLINIEKGRFAPHFYKAINENFGKRRITEIFGGDTDNIVPGKAYALIEGISLAEAEKNIGEISKITGAEFTLSFAKNVLKVQTKGQSAHAAVPHTGNNANTALLMFLKALELDTCPLTEALDGVLSLLPHNETDGKSLGVKMQDELSGELTLNFGVLNFDGKKLICGLDLRCPLCANEENVAKVIENKIDGIGFEFDGHPQMRPVHYVSPDCELIKVLLDVYEKHTGKKGECLAIGGGTYVHDIEGGVAFGIEFPDTDYRIHGADEFCNIDEMLLTANMYADVIKALCY